METAQNYFDPSRMKKRNVSFVRMKVKNRNTLNLPLPDGNLIPRGEHIIAVYEDSVQTVLDLVEDPKNIELARAAHDADLLADVMSAASADPEIAWNGKPEEMRKLIAERSNAGINRIYAAVLAETPFSIESAFRKLHNRDILPLDAAEVIETGLPEPQREEASGERDRLIEALSAALRGGNGGAEIAKQFEAMNKRMDAMAAENAELRKQLQQRRS